MPTLSKDYPNFGHMDTYVDLKYPEFLRLTLLFTLAQLSELMNYQ